MTVNRENLKRLADALEDNKGSLSDYFDMTFYTDHSSEFPEKSYPCGTIACAMGWAPTLVEEPFEGESWYQYEERVFGLDKDFEDVWDWCFREDWVYYDNTLNGAVKRIRHYLEHGLPDDFSEPESKWVEVYQ